jgi:hypothetical protein
MSPNDNFAQLAVYTAVLISLSLSIFLVSPCYLHLKMSFPTNPLLTRMINHRNKVFPSSPVVLNEQSLLNPPQQQYLPPTPIHLIREGKKS